MCSCASSDIATTAGKALDCKLSGNLAFTLADHIQYAIERVADGIVFENPLANEVRFVYPREVSLGARGIEIVRERTGIELPACEAISIALHLVNSEIDGMGSAQDMDLVMKSAVILDRATQIIEKHVGQPLDHSSYAYVRFVAHMRFLIRRLKQGGSKRTENSSLFCQAAKRFSRRLCLRPGHQRVPFRCIWMELFGRGTPLSHDACESLAVAASIRCSFLRRTFIPLRSHVAIARARHGDRA